MKLLILITFGSTIMSFLPSIYVKGQEVKTIYLRKSHSFLPDMFDMSMVDVEAMGISSDISSICSKRLTETITRFTDHINLGVILDAMDKCRSSVLNNLNEGDPSNVQQAKTLIKRFMFKADEFLTDLFNQHSDGFNPSLALYKMEEFYKYYGQCTKEAMSNEASSVREIIFWNHVENCLRSKNIYVPPL